ncbi:unnamed protein product (macronuclear) [Paramecium tetraurelia]|uniref:STIL N-terminal domain-containing protein n=1 Tax=Paramecium tetraurelia TaxID=5888 RepID=A0CHW9_PARTE|nr:uncharacterized protein GSPATT00038488001 [Paramecium tetraurelia]CAK70386.1 unnamed protein product [Paramecium tetraurelia]|eukprot:XP_001437783.1 hypothetical protein (macronuclear) [Paramecium tetraurelia strain d4-2]
MQTQDLVEYLEQDVKSFNQLFTFIPYQPSFYNFITKYQLKSIQIELKSEEFLPSIFVNDKLQHKIKYHQQFKQAYGLTNSFEFDNTISIDIISYDIEETYKEKLENDNMYPILLNFAVANSNWNADSLAQFINEKACSYNTINIDLLYLNLFRFALYFQKCNQITTFLHYPSVKFRLQEIRHTNKFVETPLTKMITKSRSSQKKEKVQYKFGFLSLDQSNRIFPLMIQDPLIFQLPLIGTWLYSNDPYDEPLNNRQYIWTMLTEYICSPYITRRICKDQYDQFLFIQFQKNQSPQFFEVSIQEDPQYKIVRSQERILNLDHHQIDLASAQPFKQIEKMADLYNPICNTNQNPNKTQNINKQEIRSAEPIQTIEQSFQQESTVKQPPVPQPLDSNQSYQSANFPQNQHLTEKLVIMQSEQLKLMQTQIIDLQRALLHQMQQPNVQQPMSPPRNEQTFHPSNKRIGLPVQKIDFLSEQLKLKTQSKKKEQEIEEIAQQILCDKIESMQNSTRNSINKLISQNNSNNSDTSHQFKISTNKKQSLGDLIISMKDSDIKRQIKRNQAMIQGYQWKYST